MIWIGFLLCDEQNFSYHVSYYLTYPSGVYGDAKNSSTEVLDHNLLSHGLCRIEEC